jgi:hypothetical protein
MVFKFASDMLWNIRRQCHRHAEPAGYGEKHMGVTKSIYQMGLLFYDKIRNLNNERPTNRQEIAFSILDR